MAVAGGRWLGRVAGPWPWQWPVAGGRAIGRGRGNPAVAVAGGRWPCPWPGRGRGGRQLKKAIVNLNSNGVVLLGSAYV